MADVYDALARRVTTASKVELLRINLEILLARINDGDTDKARSALALLVESLDDRYESAREITPVYIYINKLLLAGTREALRDAAELVVAILDGWRKVEDTAVGEGFETPEVFVGLTYGKGGALKEFTAGDNRGFEA